MKTHSLYSALSAKIMPGKAASVGAVLAPVEDMLNWPHQAAQYGCQDLLAYSSYCMDSGSIFILDMNSMQLVQTLYSSSSCCVTCIQWKLPSLPVSQHNVFLYAGDCSGTITLWDVTGGVALSNLTLPNKGPVRALHLLTRHHLLAVANDCSNYVYDAQLAVSEPCHDVELPFGTDGWGDFPILRVCASKLSAHHTICIVLGDRVRVASLPGPSHSPNTAFPDANDLIYDAEGGCQTVFDAVFSDSQEGVLYFASRNSVGAYDWKTNLLLSERLLWFSRGNAEFRRIFSSFPSSLAESTQYLPLLYSYGSNQRLCAWYVPRTDKVACVAADVRGARITSKTVANVVQSVTMSNVFAVIFTDGSVARWRFRIDCRRWILEGYHSVGLMRPTSMCALNDTVVCCGLESGHLVLLDAVHNVMLRRINVVHSGCTQIILLAPHKSGESVWVVTNRVAQCRQYHQVALFDCRNGVLQMLRKPASHDTSRMKDIVSSSTGSFLLLLFGNGNFEVWNTESEGFIYSCNELGVVGTSWVPKSLFFSVQTTIGTSELLAVMFADGTVSLWSVCKYRVVPNRDVLPLLPGSPVTSLISSMAGEVLVFAHGKGLLSLVSIESSGLCSTPLKNVPDESHVVGLAVSAVEEMRMSTAATRVDEKAPKICSDAFIAVVFGDGSFGVWNASNQERVSYTKASSVNIKAHALVWMAGALIVLTTHGDILVVDRLLSLVNSTVFDKALRRPLQNSAFFQPDHRIHIQAALELQLANTSMPFNEQDSDVPPSSISQLIHHGRYPCRGPFGQVLHSGILTLEQEMELYRHTMIPRYISDGIRQATTQNRWDELAIWVARFFHQEERQRLWYQFCLNKGLWSSALGSFGSPHLPSCERRKGWREVDPPVCYMYGDQFAEALASSEVVCKNHMHFNERRMEALDASKSKNVDDSRCRLSVARDLLKLQEPHRAIDVLMDVNNDVKCFPHMVDFAVAVASSVSTPNASPPALLASTARRAAALLLARGDLDGAVDKYMLSGHYYEAALTLQSNMRWGEAATLMRTAPLTSEQQRDLFYRWCAHIAKRGEHVEAARLLISMGSPFQALALLHASPHFKETAGLLGMVLLGNPTPCSRELLQTPLQSLDGEENASSSVLIGDVVVNALLDYSGTLRSVGNYVATWAVMGLIALVRR